jgi:hypothetical protein
VRVSEPPRWWLALVQPYAPALLNDLSKCTLTLAPLLGAARLFRQCNLGWVCRRSAAIQEFATLRHRVTALGRKVARAALRSTGRTFVGATRTWGRIVAPIPGSSLSPATRMGPPLRHEHGTTSSPIRAGRP